MIRILLIFPVLSLVVPEESFNNWIALVLFIIAGLTDHLDGYFARKTNNETSLGALLDLIADKLLVCIIIIWLLSITTSQAFLIPSLIIIARELIISAVRQFFAETKTNNPIKVSVLAKSKTTFQITAIAFWVISPNFAQNFETLTLFFLWISAYISVHSILSYIKSYRRLF